VGIIAHNQNAFPIYRWTRAGHTFAAPGYNPVQPNSRQIITADDKAESPLPKVKGGTSKREPLKRRASSSTQMLVRHRISQPQKGEDPSSSLFPK